jgi:TetR/AcrR family transcriptional regulator, transcriptional repressor for nem operon
MTGLTTKGARTRDRIVAMAADLMFVRGVAGTSLEQVREAAGVSSSQIYHYFASKDDLVRAVVEFQNTTIVGDAESTFCRLDSVAGLRAWRDQIVGHQRRMQCLGGCPIAALGSELGELDQDARLGVTAGFSRWASAIRRGFEGMRAHGVLGPEVDVETLSTATLAALQGGLLLCQMHRSTLPLENALDTMIDHVERLAQD